MPRHARNNTNSAAFTYAERQMVKKLNGTQKQRLGRDSLKNFNACSLCLEIARDPRSCLEGHLFCQECIVTSLLKQKSDIKRQNVLLERMRTESEEELAAARAAARERVLREFETTQSGLGSKGIAGKKSSAGKVDEKDDDAARGTKRKFDLDEDEIERLAKEATDEALARTVAELAESRKAKLPNFWLPSLTPTATPANVLDVKLQTLCQVAKPAHPISLKSLTVVKFTVDDKDKAQSGDSAAICPVCRKTLTNNVKAFVVRPCGDVVCGTCVDTLCRPDKSCAHCGVKVDKNPFIELKREGTGYAAGGQAEATRFDLPFQG